jgi:hypothetical protein
VKTSGVNLNSVAVLAVVAGLGVVAFYVWKKGGIGNAAAGVGAGAVEAAGGVASGAVGAIGESVGLPTPAQTTTDAAVARYVWDGWGFFEASKWSGAFALGQAAFMAVGSGTPPPEGSDLARYLAQTPRLSTGYDANENERLLNRYPSPVQGQTIWESAEPAYGFGA